MIKPIKIKSVEDANEINHFATQFWYDTYVHGKSEMIDAKSLLGLYSLVNKSDLVFVVPDDADPKRAFKGLEKFAV